MANSMKQISFFLIASLYLQDGQAKSYNLSQLMQYDNKCVCGMKEDLISTRIVHGEEAKEHEFPWLVSIFNNGRLHCGGSLINDRYILTAGHCLNWSEKEDLTVILGMHDRQEMEDMHTGGTEVKVEQFIVHEDFSSDYMHDTNDIALIKLKETVQFNDFVLPVCLPFKGHPEILNSTVAGWGTTMAGGNPANQLLRTQVTTMTNDECHKVKEVKNHIVPTMMCAYKKGTDACQGDSGGPLFTKIGQRTVQIGVVSWGIGCATDGVPGIYSRLTEYLEWIVAHTKDAKYCVDPDANKDI